MTNRLRSLLDRLSVAPMNLAMRLTVRKWLQNDTNIFETRRKFDRLNKLSGGLPAGFDAVRDSTADGAIFYRIARKGSNAPVRGVYYHGGGYIAGGLATHGGFATCLADILGGAVLLAEYRLAPEDIFPAAYDDACAVYRSAYAESQDIVVAGDSAGGGLALAVTQYAQHTAPVRPRKLVLISPWLDLTLSAKNLAANEPTDPLLTVKALTRMRDAYLAGQDPADPRASPILGELRGLPRTLIFVSAAEVLRSDSRRLKNEMEWQKTRVILHEYENMPHVFPLMAPLPAANRALKQLTAFVQTTAP
jgi:acetyl esterase/lipase